MIARHWGNIVSPLSGVMPVAGRIAQRRRLSAQKGSKKKKEERLRSGKGPKYRGLKEIKSSYESFILISKKNKESLKSMAYTYHTQEHKIL